MRRKPHSKRTLHAAKLVLLLPLALYLAFIILEKWGYWDQLRGLDVCQQVADRFERSVGPDDAVPVRVGDREFEPVVNMIRKYSSTKIPSNRELHVIARLQAKVYDAQPIGDNVLAQWTSPATPIAVMYYDWPNRRFPNGTIPRDEVDIVGTLGNFHEWIARSREDFHFLIVDLLLVGFVPLAVGLYEYIVEIRFEK